MAFLVALVTLAAIVVLYVSVFALVILLPLRLCLPKCA